MSLEQPVTSTPFVVRGRVVTPDGILEDGAVAVDGPIITWVGPAVDAPAGAHDLRPQPKARRNEPAHLPHILRAVARALGKPAEQLAAETTRNARTFFGLQ